MNPLLVSSGIGLLGSIFGGGSSTPKTPKYLTQNYKLQNQLLQRGIDLYDGTDLAAQDAATVAAFGNGVMDRAMTMLGNYDARAAAAGSPMGKMDTKKDRSRAQIAGDASSQISQLEANLNQTRAARQAAMLPNPAQAAAGAQAASLLDQYAYNRQQQQQSGVMEGLASAANLIASLTAKKPKDVAKGSGAAMEPYRPGGTIRNGKLVF